MKKYFNTLMGLELFHGISPDQLEPMLSCLTAETAVYQRGELLLMAGDKPEYVGIVLEGSLQILKEDYDGNATIMALLQKGGLFAEALCCAGVKESPVTVIANSDAEVLLVNFSRILRICQNSCDFHHRLIENMLGILARKNLFLQSRIELLRMKSIRERVLHYLHSLPQGSQITIPLNRGEMADYLGVERSALSHELIKMKRDGLIDYRKNVFTFK